MEVFANYRMGLLIGEKGVSTQSKRSARHIQLEHNHRRRKLRIKVVPEAEPWTPPKRTGKVGSGGSAGESRPFIREGLLMLIEHRWIEAWWTEFCPAEAKVGLAWVRHRGPALFGGQERRLGWVS